MTRCFRCDGVGCMECIPDMADYRVSQEASGRATRSVAESLRVTPPSSPAPRAPLEPLHE